MPADKGVIRHIAESLCKIHEDESKKNSKLKSLAFQKQVAVKASRKLISALNKGLLRNKRRFD